MPNETVAVEDTLPRATSGRKRGRKPKDEMVVMHQRQSATAEHTANAVKLGLESAALAIPVGVGIWIGSRLARPIGRSDLQGDSSNLEYPGVKAYIADTVGLIVGPALAPALPKRLHDNGIALANQWSAYFDNNTTAEGRDLVSASVATEGWYQAVWQEDASDTTGNPYRLIGFTFQTDVLVMLTLLFTAGLVGIGELVKAFAQKVVP